MDTRELGIIPFYNEFSNYIVSEYDLHLREDDIDNLIKNRTLPSNLAAIQTKVLDTLDTMALQYLKRGIKTFIEDKIDLKMYTSVFVGGAVVQWLRDELGLIQSAAITEQLANSVPDNGGVYFVPALTGLGAPYWDQYARGVIIGITRGTSTAHLTRAALEGICYQVYDVLMAMENDIHAKPKEIRVDGGAIANNFLMQFQADICRCPVVRPRVLETTALGAAYLAGLAIGYWKDVDELKEQWSLDNIFSAEMHEETAETLLTEWHKAVGRSLNWAAD